MTQRQIRIQIEAIREVTKRVCQSKETALKFLEEAGILELIERSEKEYQEDYKEEEKK